MTYTVVHRTSYVYDGPVSVSFGEAHLLPRAMPGQRVISSSLTIAPEPESMRERRDYFGNRTHHFALHADHETLEVTARSEVEVRGRGAAGQLLEGPAWEEVARRLATRTDPGGALDDTLIAASEYVLPSPQAPLSRAAAAYAVPSFRPGRPLLEAVMDLSGRIHRELAFSPGTSTVGTPVEQVLAARGGVCQDFAHLTVSALRSLGLAARYVSGYLETDPPPGRPKLQGADVSHAWPSVFVPDMGWVDVDPTNDQLVGDRYITTAWGRDYGDVAPLKGVIFTDADSQALTVSVDVRRTSEVPPSPAPHPHGATP